MGWSEKLIEPGNSWFSPKQLLGWRRVFPLGVEHWMVLTGSNLARPTKLRIPEVITRQLDSGGEAPRVKTETAVDLKLRSLNSCSVHLRRSDFLDNEDVGLEAAII